MNVQVSILTKHSFNTCVMYFQTPTREMGLKDVCFNEAILSYMKADIYKTACISVFRDFQVIEEFRNNYLITHSNNMILVLD